MHEINSNVCSKLEPNQLEYQIKLKTKRCFLRFIFQNFEIFLTHGRYIRRYLLETGFSYNNQPILYKFSHPGKPIGLRLPQHCKCRQRWSPNLTTIPGETPARRPTVIKSLAHLRRNFNKMGFKPMTFTLKCH